MISSSEEKACRNPNCDNTFRPNRSTDKYCSPSCYYETRKKIDSKKRSEKSKKPKSKKCSFCEKEFTPYNSLTKFCSVNCRIENDKSNRSRNWSKKQCENISGAKNPAFRNGKYIVKNKKDKTGDREFQRNKKLLKKQIKEEKGYLCCEYCGTSKSLKFETHHLIFRSEKPLHEFLHDIRNLLYVCINCHNNFHKIKGLRNKLVEKRKLYLLFGNDVRNK